MIKNLYKLGKALDTGEEHSGYFEPWQNPFPTGDKDKLKIIYFPIANEKVMPFEIEAFRPTYLKKYLYRKPSGSNGAPLLPTDYFSPSKNIKKHTDHVRKLFKRLVRVISKPENIFFSSNSKREEGLKIIESQLLSFDGDYKDRYLLTFKIDGKWLGEFDKNIELIEEEAYFKYYKESKAKNKICSVTYQKTDEVWGKVDTLGFTVNTITFSRGGFNEKEAYKMFPVSPLAVKRLEGAKEYAFEKLKRTFYNLEYIIIPHFIQESDELIRKAVKLIETKEEERSLQDLSKSIFQHEKVLQYLAEANDLAKEGVFYDIFFFQRNQRQFSIKLHLTDMLPSRFSQIFRAKQKTEQKYRVLNRITNKKGEVTEFYITFSRIQRYFSQIVQKKPIFQPFFFKVLEAVFYGLKLEKKSFISAFVKQIQQDFKQKNEFKFKFIHTTKEAWALLYFFEALNLFKSTNKNLMEEPKNMQNIDDFMAAHQAFFDIPYQKAAFFMGCLTALLTYSQFKNIGSEPFLERLNSLSFDDKDLRKLYPLLLDKMGQYESAGKNKYLRDDAQKLKAAITPILMDETTLSRTEISFAFSAGLVMQREFRKEDKKDSNSDSNK